MNTNKDLTEMNFSEFCEYIDGEGCDIATDKVTMAMVREAQYKLEELGHARDCRDFNRLLIELFSVLPRQMGQVQNYLASSANDMGKIVQREQDLLDVMRGQVAIPVAKKTNENGAAQTMVVVIGLLWLLWRLPAAKHSIFMTGRTTGLESLRRTWILIAKVPTTCLHIMIRECYAMMKLWCTMKRK